MLCCIIMSRKSCHDLIEICEEACVQGSGAFYELEEFTQDCLELLFVRLDFSGILMSGHTLSPSFPAHCPFFFFFFK